MLVDFLLRARAQFAGRDLPRESKYGSTVEVGIGQAVDEVPRARSGRRNADPKLSRKLCYGTKP